MNYIPKTNSWSNSFYRVVEDFEHGSDDVAQFKDKLFKLGCPSGYVDWLVYMMTRRLDDQDRNRR